MQPISRLTGGPLPPYLRSTYRPFQVNEGLRTRAKPGARSMDCLPADPDLHAIGRALLS